MVRLGLIVVTYTHMSAYEVLIQGTWVIPEFPSVLIMLLFIVTTTIIIILYKRRRTINGISLKTVLTSI
jgi:hypothetical protein